MLINILTRGNEKIIEMISTDPFMAAMKCSGNGFFHGNEGLCNPSDHLHNILEYLQIAIIKTEAANFVKTNICVNLQTFGHDCTPLWIHNGLCFVTGHNDISKA